MARSYTLPADLLDDVDALPNNRTAVLRSAIDLAHRNPSLLVSALESRIKRPGRPESRSCRVTVSFSDDTVKKLSELTSYSQLPTEHVLRLATEARLSHR